ncbi:MAG: class I SAM-dependent methyltransferase [Deltaproteobacteria bacterium]|nr:class I SAM-dependent methyltransferase [Deltaproteobacteria bacterium]
MALCREALAIKPRFNEAHKTMGHALMPGTGYKELIKRIHETIKPETYLEIGVLKGGALTLALEDTKTIGIDPQPKIEPEIPSKARIYPTYSDTFFKRYNLFEEFGADKLDLVFIDGLHHYDQVLRDFINVEKYASKQTVVLFHDVYPPTEISAQRERVTKYWAGDTWKIIPCLKETRPDLKIDVIPTYPCGLGVVTNLDNTSTHLRDNLKAFTDKYDALPFSKIEEDRERFLNATENSWENILKLIEPGIRA